MAIRRSGAVGAFYVKVGEELRQRRTNLGLKQEDLAVRVQLSRASIANVESGRQAIPIHHLVEIADALGVSASEILKAAEVRSIEVVTPLPSDAPSTVREFVRSLSSAS